MKKSRLKKEAMMPVNMFQSQLDQISDKGRDVLKSIEDYKFFVDQTSRVMKNDPALTEMIQSKKKNLEQSSQQIYDVVFDIENMDINAIYQRQQETINKEQEKPEEKKPEENKSEVSPENDKSEDTPENNKSEEKPPVNTSEDKPAEENHQTKPLDKKPEEEKSEEKPPVTTSRLRHTTMKREGSYIESEEAIFQRFPKAEKTNDHQYIAKENGITYFIGYDSLIDSWRIFGRTKSDPSVFQRLMDYFIR